MRAPWLLVAFALWAVGVEADANRAIAQERLPTVVVLQMGPNFPDQAWPEAEQRVAAELSVAGLMILSVPADMPYDEDQGEALDEVARRHGASGAMVLVRKRETGDVRVWIRDRSTNETVVHTVPSSDLDGPDAAAVVALRVTEVIVANELEFSAPPPDPPPPPPAEPLEPAIPAEEDPPLRVRAHLGATVMGGPDGILPLVGPVLGATLEFALPLSLGVEVAATPLMATVTEGGDSASVGVGLARAHLFYEPLRDSPISISIGVGGGMMVAWALGDAAAPNIAADDVTVVGVLSARLGLSVKLGGEFAALAGFSALVAVPEVQVFFSDVEVATVGRPLFDVLLALEWRPGSSANARASAAPSVPEEPDGTDPDGSLDAAPEEEPEARLPSGQIRGVIQDYTGLPVAATIIVMPQEERITADGSGLFEIDVAPGEYQVIIRAEGYLEQRRPVVVEQRGVTILNIDLRRR